MCWNEEQTRQKISLIVLFRHVMSQVYSISIFKYFAFTQGNIQRGSNAYPERIVIHYKVQQVSEHQNDIYRLIKALDVL